MKISHKQYAQTLFELVKDAPAPKARQVIVDFAKLLVARHEAFRFDRIVGEFNKLWDKEYGVVAAEISSFSPLNQKTTELLQEYIKKVSGADTIVTTSKIDKDILGGVVIKYGDKIFDAGLKSRLNKLKEKIIS